VSFDRIAPHYRWLETLVFGNALQRARVAFVRALGSPRRVLVVGEGDGRFLAEFARAYPEAAVDCVEASARMIELARGRIGDRPRLNFICANLDEVRLETNYYDLVVTHFFLDCFAEERLRAVIAKLANSAAPKAEWLVADFCEPLNSWNRLAARFLIAGMYSFFRVIAGIEARCLVDYHPLLQAHGFTLAKTVFSPNEMIRSELWQRTPPPG
jgi:ubiquinone/menaquinone biosynthesis C-methylase UbiE